MHPAEENELTDSALPGSTVEDLDAAPDFTADGHEVTMRGDLEQISLSDIIQTLSMSKMEGILRLCNPTEQRALYCKDGQLQDLVFGRPKHRRIGERLAHAGLITPDQLHAALVDQRKSREPLGRILVRHGVLTKQQIEDLVYNQAAEDLYSLFTWKHASFEFYKGTPRDARVTERIRAVPAFEASSVLLDVARRADEWDLIIEAIHGTDEVVVPTDVAPAEDLPSSHASVLALVDGESSIREISEMTLLGLFDCARIFRDLRDWNLVDVAAPEDLLRVAEKHFAAQDPRAALIVLRTLAARNEAQPLTPDTTRDLAHGLERAGDSRLAARALWLTARNTDPMQALELLREACQLDKRSAYLCEALVKSLDTNGSGAAELTPVLSQLVDALVEEGREEAALTQLERLEDMAPDRAAVVSRKARLLQKLERNDEAVQELEQLAEVLRESSRREQLATVYEQILIIDARRKDIAKALATLRVSKKARRLRRLGAAAAVLVGLGGTGFVYWESLRTEQLHLLSEDITAKIGSGDLAGANAAIDEALTAFGPRPELDSLTDLARQRAAQLEADRRRREEDALRARLREADAHLEGGQVTSALDVYEDLLGSSDRRETVEGSAKARLGALGRELEKLAAKLPHQVPEPASDVQSERTRRAVLEELRTVFRDEDLASARGFLEARRHETLTALLGDEHLERILAHATRVEEAFATARQREEDYESIENEAEAKQRLQPVFLSAQEHEKSHAFEQAAQAYALLHEEYPADNELKQHFETQRSRYRGLADSVAEVARATAAGDHPRALELFQELARSEPNIPFPKLVRLPVRVATSPPGAEVSVNGTPAGKTPITSSYVPGEETTVRVDLAGFHPQEKRIDGEFDGMFNAVLVKAPDWANLASGSVEQQPVCDAEGRAMLVDRGGAISAVATDSGDVLWSFPTGDLAGLLGRPTLVADNVVVTSFDGTLRCLARDSGELQWERDGVPSSSGAIVLQQTIVVGTTDGHAIGARADTGEPVFRAELPGPVETNLATDGDLAFITTSNGWVIGIGPKGRVRWHQRIGERIAAGAVTGRASVFAVTDDGLAVALSAKTGEIRWQAGGMGEVTLQPAVAAGSLVVVGTDTIRTLSLADGSAGPSFGGRPWSTPPSVAGEVILVGTAQGTVAVLDQESLALRYLIRGKGRISAAPAMDGAGRAIAAFESRVLQGFRSLP